MTTRDRRPLLLAITAVVILLDRLTKAWIVAHIPEDTTIPVWDHIFRLSHVRNPGAAFSLFTDSTHPELTHQLLAWFSILAAAVIFVLLIRLGRRATPTTVALALVLGGTIGNLWDRLRYGMVTDFLEVHIVHYHWPDFNVSDSAIVCGGILLILDSLRPRPPGSAQQADGRSAGF
ncbi:MAG TPA: signal peptidase II [Acidobacteriaceae bacterium]|jgi:signal peptidase II|nr:signal peptidase II [Acidobacteriaceae bacterium]